MCNAFPCTLNCVCSNSVVFLQTQWLSSIFQTSLFHHLDAAIFLAVGEPGTNNFRYRRRFAIATCTGANNATGFQNYLLKQYLLVWCNFCSGWKFDPEMNKEVALVVRLRKFSRHPLQQSIVIPDAGSWLAMRSTPGQVFFESSRSQQKESAVVELTRSARAVYTLYNTRRVV